MIRSPFTVTVLAGSGLVAGPSRHRARRDVELAAVAVAVDGAVADLRHRAAHVRADGAEGLELARRRLGDDRLGGRDDRAATDRDVGLGDARGVRRSHRRSWWPRC